MEDRLLRAGLGEREPDHVATSLKHGARLLGQTNLIMSVCSTLPLPTLVFLVKDIGLSPSVWCGAATSMYAVGCIIGFCALQMLTDRFSVRALLVLCNIFRVLSGVCHILLFAQVSVDVAAMLVLLGRVLAGIAVLSNPMGMAWVGAALPKETRSSVIMWLTLNIMGGMAVGGPLGSLGYMVSERTTGSVRAGYTIVPGVIIVLLSTGLLIRSLCVFHSPARLHDFQSLRPRSASMGSPIRTPLLVLFLLTTFAAWTSRSPWDALLPVYMDQHYSLTADQMWLPMLLNGGSPFVGGVLYMVLQQCARDSEGTTRWLSSALHVALFKLEALLVVVVAMLLLLHVSDLNAAPSIATTLSGITLASLPFSWVTMGTSAAIAVEMPPERQPLCAALMNAAQMSAAGIMPVALSQVWSARVSLPFGICSPASSPPSAPPPPLLLSPPSPTVLSGEEAYDACSANAAILIMVTAGVCCYVLLLFYPSSVLKGPESSKHMVVEPLDARPLDAVAGAQSGEGAPRRPQLNRQRSSLYMVLSGDVWKRLQAEDVAQPAGALAALTVDGPADGSERSLRTERHSIEHRRSLPNESSRRVSEAVVSFRDEPDDADEGTLALAPSTAPSRRTSASRPARRMSGAPLSMSDRGASLDMILDEEAMGEYEVDRGSGGSVNQ